jgi:hypothetical protein
VLGERMRVGGVWAILENGLSRKGSLESSVAGKGSKLEGENSCWKGVENSAKVGWSSGGGLCPKSLWEGCRRNRRTILTRAVGRGKGSRKKAGWWRGHVTFKEESGRVGSAEQ